jgi:transcriptional regulator with XRE-family HTH domain
MNNQQHVGDLIREARELSGTTLTQLAVLVKVNPATLSHLERDFGVGSNDLVVRSLQVLTRLLADKCGVPHEDRWTCAGCEDQLRSLIAQAHVGRAVEAVDGTHGHEALIMNKFFSLEAIAKALELPIADLRKEIAGLKTVLETCGEKAAKIEAMTAKAEERLAELEKGSEVSFDGKLRLG